METVEFEGVIYYRELDKYYVLDGFGKLDQVSALTAAMILEAETLALAALAAYRGEA